MPSRNSSEPRSRPWAWPSSSIASDKFASSMSFSSFFAVRWASGGNPRNSSTSRSVAASSLGSATHSVAMPHSWAWWPGMRRERMTMSLARVTPIIFLQPRCAARSRDLSQTLLWQRIKAGLGDDAEIAGQRQFETDAKTIAAAGGDHRLTAARRGGDVPGEARDVLGRGLEKARNLATARKMLAGGPQHDDADARIGGERLEHRAQLFALGHRDDVERLPVEDHVGALPLGIRRQAEAVETFGEHRHQRRRIAHAIPSGTRRRQAGGARSCRPAILGFRRQTRTRAGACNRRG